VKLFKKILAFVLALLLIIPAVQFNFGSGVKKAYAITFYQPINNNLWTKINVPQEVINKYNDKTSLNFDGNQYINSSSSSQLYVNLPKVDGYINNTIVVYGVLKYYHDNKDNPKTFASFYIYNLQNNTLNLLQKYIDQASPSFVFNGAWPIALYSISDKNTVLYSVSDYNSFYMGVNTGYPPNVVNFGIMNSNGKKYVVVTDGGGHQLTFINDKRVGREYGFSNYAVVKFFNSHGRTFFVTNDSYYSGISDVTNSSNLDGTLINNYISGPLDILSDNTIFYISSDKKLHKKLNSNDTVLGSMPSQFTSAKTIKFSDDGSYGYIIDNSNNIFLYMDSQISYLGQASGSATFNNIDINLNGTVFATDSNGNFYINNSIPQMYAPSYSVGGIRWSNNSNNRGTGYVTLNWSSAPNATGYKVWIFDGNQYRTIDVGNTTSWDSRSNVNGKIWPTESTNPSWSSIINSSNNSISTDVFNHSGGGGDLLDDPNLLYQRTVGTSYDSNHYYTFAVSAYNQYGESTISPINITLPNMTDTNAPIISSFTIDDGAAKTGSPQLKLSISASDTGGSGLSKIEISTDNFTTIQQTVSASGNSFSTTISNFQVPATPGTINVYVRAWDVAGNVSSVQKAQIALMNDVTPPTAQLKINNGAEFTTSPNVSLYITAYDDWTPIDQLLMRLSNDGKNWTNWMPLALTYNWTLDSGSQGYKSVFLQVQDASANVGTTSAGILYSTDPNVIKGSQADTTPPTISYLSLAKGATVTTSFTPTVTLVASDNVTPQNQLHVYASADGVNWVDLGLLTSNNKTLPSGLVTSGFNSIEFKVEDSSYNDTVRTLEFFKL